jgi:hypothetical protein
MFPAARPTLATRRTTRTATSAARTTPAAAPCASDLLIGSIEQPDGYQGKAVQLNRTNDRCVCATGAGYFSAQ